VTAIEDRIDRVTGRIKKWLQLQQKANHEKKIAFVLYDYPPGEDNLGSAAYLDTFESMKILLERMGEEGYSVDCEKISGEKIHELFLNAGIVNSGNWTPMEKTACNAFTMGNDAYKQCFGKLSAAQRDLMMGEWGNPPGGVMTFEQDFLIPAVEFGNVLIGLQPSRGIHENPEKAYHDKTIPPHHHYIAFYRWLEEVWGADAVVHVGTHGTLEFAKGKEVGMSGECFPDVLIGDLPHLYIYHVVNASEAMIAKRRSYATIVNYNSPSFAASELYEGIPQRNSSELRMSGT
jgi:cobaltochelatase CobN